MRATKLVLERRRGGCAVDAKGDDRADGRLIAAEIPGTAGKEKFVVHNDGANYTGSARLAHRMGITTPLSTNPAMTIGGLTVGVTPIDMAHAYETLAHGGRRVSGTLAEHGRPVAIQEVDAGSLVLPDGNHKDVNHVRSKAVLPLLRAPALSGVGAGRGLP